MRLDKRLEPFRAAIESFQRLLHKFNDRGVIIGGVAVGFLGDPDLKCVIHVASNLKLRICFKLISYIQAIFRNGSGGVLVVFPPFLCS